MRSTWYVHYVQQYKYVPSIFITYWISSMLGCLKKIQIKSGKKKCENEVNIIVIIYIRPFHTSSDLLGDLTTSSWGPN